MQPAEALAEYRRLQTIDTSAAEKFATLHPSEIIIATERELREKSRTLALNASVDKTKKPAFTKAFKEWEQYRITHRRVIKAWERLQKPQSHWHKSQRISSI